MLIHSIKILRLCRRQFQHHVNGFYSLWKCLFAVMTDDTVGYLQQPAHLHLPHTGSGYAHGIVNR